MSGGNVEQAISRTSVHEDIIREVEETDWTIDPIEEEDVSTCATANEADSKEDVANESRNIEEEEEDNEFDPDELECVDEDADEERKEREDSVRDKRERVGRHIYEEKRHRLDVRSRHAMERHHHYDRGDRRDFRGGRDIGRTDKYRSELGRQRRPFNHRPRRVESYAPKRPRRSNDREDKGMRNGDDRDIPFEELELEEVDCYDEVGSDSEFAGGASDTGEFHGEDGDHGDVSMSRSRGPNHVSNFDGDDDFPDLCEDIDEDAMRRAAAASAVKNIVLLQASSAEAISSPPSENERTVSKTREASPHLRDLDSRKMVASTLSRNEERRDDEARQRHHCVERNGIRTKRDGWKQIDVKRCKTRENQESRFITASSTTKLDVVEAYRHDDAELVSVKGPLAHGWCSVDDEEMASTSSAPSNPSNISKFASRKVGSWRSSPLSTAESSTTEERSSSLVILPKTHSECHSVSPSVGGNKYIVSPFDSAKRKDHRVHGSPTDYSSSLRCVTSEHSHQPQLLRTNGTTATLGSTGFGKIPSLLDMCIKEPLELQQPSTAQNGIGSRVRMDGGNVQIQSRETITNKEVRKGRSLLDLDIPPPDRKMMRQYAIVLNSLELTQRPSRVRVEKRKTEVPAKIQKLSSPRPNDCSGSSRQPRSYIHGVGKLSQ